MLIGNISQMEGELAKKWKCCSNLEKKTRTAQSSGFIGFFQKGTLSYDWGKLYRKSFWSLTICGFPHTVTPKTRHIILDAVHAIRNMLLSHRASFFTVKISPVPDISTEKESDEKLDFDCI